MSCTIDDRSDLLFDTFKKHVSKFVQFYEKLKSENKSTTTMENLSFDIETLRKQADDKKLIRESNYREYITRTINTIMKAKIKILKELDDQPPEKEVIGEDTTPSTIRKLADLRSERDQLFLRANISSEVRKGMKNEFDAINDIYLRTDLQSEKLTAVVNKFIDVIKKQIHFLETLAERTEAKSSTTKAGEKGEDEPSTTKAGEKGEAVPGETSEAKQDRVKYEDLREFSKNLLRKKDNDKPAESVSGGDIGNDDDEPTGGGVSIRNTPKRNKIRSVDLDPEKIIQRLTPRVSAKSTTDEDPEKIIERLLPSVSDELYDKYDSLRAIENVPEVLLDKDIEQIIHSNTEGEATGGDIGNDDDEPTGGGVSIRNTPKRNKIRSVDLDPEKIIQRLTPRVSAKSTTDEDPEKIIERLLPSVSDELYDKYDSLRAIENVPEVLLDKDIEQIIHSNTEGEATGGDIENDLSKVRETLEKHQAEIKDVLAELTKEQAEQKKDNDKPAESVSGRDIGTDSSNYSEDIEKNKNAAISRKLLDEMIHIVTEGKSTGRDIGYDDDEPTGGGVSMLKSHIKSQQDYETSVGNPNNYENYIQQLSLKDNTVIEIYKEMIENNVSDIKENFKGEGVTDKIVIEIAESINSEYIAINDKHKSGECTDEDYVRFIQASLNTIYFVFDNLDDETTLKNLLLDDDNNEISTEKKFSDIIQESKKIRQPFVDTAFDELIVFQEQGQFTCFEFVGNKINQDNPDIIQSTFKVWYKTFNPESFKRYLDSEELPQKSMFLREIHAITRHSKSKKQIQFVTALKDDKRFIQQMYFYINNKTLTTQEKKNFLHYNDIRMKQIFEYMFCFRWLKDKTLSEADFDNKTKVSLIIHGFPIIEEAFNNFKTNITNSGYYENYSHKSNLARINKRINDLKTDPKYDFDSTSFRTYVQNEKNLARDTKRQIIASIEVIKRQSMTLDGRQLVEERSKDERFLNSIFTVINENKNLPQAVNNKQKYTKTQMTNKCKELLYVTESNPQWIRNHKQALIPLVLAGYPAIKEAYIRFRLKKQNETQDNFSHSEYVLQIWVRFTIEGTQFYFMQGEREDDLHDKYQKFTYSEIDPVTETHCIAFVNASIQKKKEKEKEEEIEYSISNLFLQPQQVNKFGQQFISQNLHYIENNVENGFFGGDVRTPGFKEHQSILFLSFSFYEQLNGIKKKLPKTLNIDNTSFYDKNTNGDITLYDYTDVKDGDGSFLIRTLEDIFMKYEDPSNKSNVRRVRDTLFTKKGLNYKLRNPIELLLIIFHIIQQEQSIYEVSKNISTYLQDSDSKKLESKIRIFHMILRTATDALLMYLFGVDKTNVFKTLQILKTKQNDVSIESDMLKKLRFFIILYLANVEDDNRMTIPALNIFMLCFEMLTNKHKLLFANIFPSLNQLKYSLKENYFQTYFEELPHTIDDESLQLAPMGTPQKPKQTKRSPIKYTLPISTPRKPNLDSPDKNLSYTSIESPDSPNVELDPQKLNFDSPKEGTTPTESKIGSSNTRR